MQKIDVAAALILDRGHVMLCRRPKGKAHGELWELPGGKLEAGESGEAALRRECMEELGVELTVGTLAAETHFHYPELTVHLLVYRASLGTQKPRLLEHTALCWCTAEQALSMELSDADREILFSLAPRWNALTAEK